MAPSETRPVNTQTAERIEMPSLPQQAYGAQPAPTQPMKLERPQESEVNTLSLRGGRSEACPGRFCFIVPCPIPCDFCVI